MESRSKADGGGGGSSRPPQAPRPTTPRQQVKVKHIVTTEVSTDEASFKDVVQSLTGKDSGATRAAAVAAGGSSRRSNDAVRVDSNHNRGVASGEDTVAGVLPSEEEMKWFWHGGVRD